MIKVLFVCLGNVCRSPMAEAMFKQEVAAAGLSNQIKVDSAALNTYGAGTPTNPNALRVMHAHGLDDDNHHSRVITQQDFADFDLIIGMDDQNLFELRNLAPAGTESKIHGINDCLPDKKGQPIDDPYYTRRFEKTYQDLAVALPAWLNAIQKGL